MRKQIKRYSRAVIMVCAVFGKGDSFAADDPNLSAPAFGIRSGAAQLSLINCGDTNLQFVVQTSTNLLDWVSVTTNFATGPGSPVTVPATNTFCFYRLVTIPHVLAPMFQYAIMTVSNFDKGSHSFTVDSFDSSNPLYSTLGLYNSALRRANGDVATDSLIVGDVGGGNGNIFGHVKTGPGTQQSDVHIGANGAVGDTAWQASNTGIQSGYWSGNFFLNIPDVQPPVPGITLLPAAVSNVVTLNGGNYTVSSTDTNLNKQLKITGPTILWVQGSYSPVGITIASSNNASLALYVGQTNGTGDSATLAGQNKINYPGFAKNLQFYGLPSLTSLSVHGNAVFVGTIYAPQADATFGGGGNNNSDTSGAIIVKSLTLGVNWNFHYDENLRVNGPIF